MNFAANFVYMFAHFELNKYPEGMQSILQSKHYSMVPSLLQWMQMYTKYSDINFLIQTFERLELIEFIKFDARIIQICFLNMMYATYFVKVSKITRNQYNGSHFAYSI